MTGNVNLSRVCTLFAGPNSKGYERIVAIAVDRQRLLSLSQIMNLLPQRHARIGEIILGFAKFWAAPVRFGDVCATN